MLKFCQGRSRAFVLLATMLVVLILGMIIRVAIIRMPSVLASSRQSVAHESATKAAESGLDYAPP
jgi:type II secretory pathway pseudopilin PulG